MLMIYHPPGLRSTTLITDANGLLADFDIDISQGNSSIIS